MINVIQPNFSWKPGATFGKNDPKFVIIHHALAKKCTVDDIHKWHLKNGWSGFGYHYFVDKRGNIFKGRKDEWNGAQCKEEGMNEQSIGICLEGCYEDYEEQTDKVVPKDQLASLQLLVKSLMDKYKIPAGNIKRHTDYAHYKKCPGNYFPWKEFLSGLTLQNKNLESAVKFLSDKSGIDYELWLKNSQSKNMAFLDLCFEKIAAAWQKDINKI